MLENEGGQETADEQVEETFDSLESKSGPTQPPIEKETAAPPATTPKEYEINFRGQTIKAPIDKIIRWAQSGYDAPNKIGELNKQLETLKTEQQKWQGIQQKYAPVDEYFSKNPDAWKHVETTWQEKQKA